MKKVKETLSELSKKAGKLSGLNYEVYVKLYSSLVANHVDTLTKEERIAFIREAKTIDCDLSIE